MKVPIVDGHIDTFAKVLKEGKDFLAHVPGWHVDFPRLKKAGVKLQFAAVYTPPKFVGAPATLYALRVIAIVHATIQRSRGQLMLISSREDVTHLLKSGKIGLLLCIEGGLPLASEILLLDIFYNLGVRLLTLTHNPRNELGDGVGTKKNPRGLTQFGKEVVKKMQSLGMVVDVAHLGTRGFRDVVRLAHLPIVSSHTGVRALCDVPRNLYDWQLKEIAYTDGIVGIDFLPGHILKGRRDIQLSAVVDHIAYVADKFGVRHVGFGSDFDGFDGYIEGLEDVTGFPSLVKVLSQRGFNKDELRAILGGNFLRVLRKSLGEAPC